MGLRHAPLSDIRGDAQGIAGEPGNRRGARREAGPRAQRRRPGRSSLQVRRDRTASVGSPRKRAGPARRARQGGDNDVTAAFIAQCEAYFSRGDGMIDQMYQRRLPEGMVRCYLVRDRVAGFGEQLVNALYPAEPGAAANSAPQPGPRLYYPPTRADFQRLKGRLEREWLDQLCGIVGLEKRNCRSCGMPIFSSGRRRPMAPIPTFFARSTSARFTRFPTTRLAPLLRDARKSSDLAHPSATVGAADCLRPRREDNVPALRIERLQPN